jgi:hypothetical protein
MCHNCFFFNTRMVVCLSVSSVCLNVTQILNLSLIHAHTHTHTQYGVDVIKSMLLGSLNETNVTAAAQYAHHIECSEIMSAARRCAEVCLPKIAQVSRVGVSAHVVKTLMCAYRKGGMAAFWFVDRYV